MPCIRLACCGTRGTSEKPSAHKNDDFEIAALVFTLRKVTCSCIVKTCLKKAQVKASRQQITNLTVHYPQNSELLEPTVVYTKLPYLAEGCIYQTAVSRPEIYRTAVTRPKLPPVRIVRVVPLSFGISLGLSNRYDGQGSMRHHAELWNQRLQNGCTGESIKI